MVSFNSYVKLPEGRSSSSPLRNMNFPCHDPVETSAPLSDVERDFRELGLENINPDIKHQDISRQKKGKWDVIDVGLSENRVYPQYPPIIAI